MLEKIRTDRPQISNGVESMFLNANYNQAQLRITLDKIISKTSENDDITSWEILTEKEYKKAKKKMKAKEESFAVMSEAIGKGSMDFLFALKRKNKEINEFQPRFEWKEMFPE